MKQENKQGQKKLTDFLDKKPEEAADDFEKEALEGFAMLSDEAEIHELKNKTDKKVFESILAEESKTPASIYWYAAAGLLLCIGLSVFFVMKNDKKAEQNLAIKQGIAKPETVPSIPEMKPDAQEQTPLTEKSTGAAESKTSKLKSIESDFNSNIASKDETKNAKKSEKISEEVGLSEINAGSIEPIASSGAGKGDVASAAPPAQPVESASPPDTKTNGAELDYASKEDVAVNESDEKESALQEIEVKQKARAKSEPRKKTANDDILAAPSAQIEAASASACYYTGGSKKIAKQIRKDLEDKKLNRAFSARLYVNTKNQVEKVDVLTETVFSAQEKEELIKILKKLDKFSNTTGSTASYTLEYKP
ncbi:MAG: hypothetical protein JNL60_00715 [Bacteroidia bacterium]|nr:hypothetical protein [Bacteroidia bacterium]